MTKNLAYNFFCLCKIIKTTEIIMPVANNKMVINLKVKLVGLMQLKNEVMKNKGKSKAETTVAIFTLRFILKDKRLVLVFSMASIVCLWISKRCQTRKYELIVSWAKILGKLLKKRVRREVIIFKI